MSGDETRGGHSVDQNYSLIRPQSLVETQHLSNYYLEDLFRMMVDFMDLVLKLCFDLSMGYASIASFGTKNSIFFDIV